MNRIAGIPGIAPCWRGGRHLADRFLVGYPYNGQWHQPEMKVVSLYVDRKPEGDLSEERAREFGFKVYPTIAETLRLAVVAIGTVVGILYLAGR